MYIYIYKMFKLYAYVSSKVKKLLKISLLGTNIYFIVNINTTI
jgi:hypothetical protein